MRPEAATFRRPDATAPRLKIDRRGDVRLIGAIPAGAAALLLLLVFFQQTMNPTTPEIIVSAEGFSLRPDLALIAEIKAAKLRRHRQPAIGRVRLHLRLETDGPVPEFSACLHAESGGPDFVTHDRHPSPTTVIKSAFAKLERAISANAGARKHARHQLPLTELSAAVRG